MPEIGEHERAECMAARAFREALLRVMRIAGRDDEDARKVLTQRQLAERSGVGVTTIKTCMRADAGASKVRLETLDKLAAALGLPPAFLLMRREDWVALATAVEVLVAQAREPGDQQSAGHVGPTNPVNAAAVGVEYARSIKMLEKPRPFHALEMAQAISATEAGVANTSALPPYALIPPRHVPLVLAICSIVGTTTGTNKNEVME